MTAAKFRAELDLTKTLSKSILIPGPLETTTFSTGTQENFRPQTASTMSFREAQAPLPQPTLSPDEHRLLEKFSRDYG